MNAYGSQTHLYSYFIAFAKMRRDNVSECEQQVDAQSLFLQVCPVTHFCNGLTKPNESRRITLQNLANNIPMGILLFRQMF